ncbi:palmitoyltransferase, putative [Plasmodium relictum]|uniref:Palmitoyltransferase n=1 Tax=Plasmodium relictum TaxID=85471 RepID=A0A1J1H4Q6_PLARL|nr:palmitoyltransferase, putative [Plasmodium relictum]CRG99539.1 palmitoyltransferase, putative [Plasmodium relictum]
MINILPYVVVLFRFSVLITCINLKEKYNLILGKLNNLFFFYFVSFLLYIISSCRNPGYVTTCPLTYIKANNQELNYIREKNKNNIKKKINKTKNNKSSNCSVSSYESSLNSLSTSSTYEENQYDELDSLTIIHHENENTIITEKGIKKNLKQWKQLVDKNKIIIFKENEKYSNEMVKNRKNKKKYINYLDEKDHYKRKKREYVNSNRPNNIEEYINIYGKLQFYSKIRKYNFILQKMHKEMRNKTYRLRKMIKKYRNKHKPISLIEINKISCLLGNAKNTRPKEKKKKIQSSIMLHKINKNDIIFSKDIKTNNKTIFYLYNYKYYQYNTQLQYCIICNIFQPLRTKHCKICKRCVRTFDHHCPWINNCVAENNRCFFLLYLYFEDITICLSLKYISLAMYHLFFYENGFFYCWLIILFFILVFFFLMIFCLIIYHSYLCLINETTWENVSKKKISYLKNISKKHNNPFFLSYKKNVIIYFCYFPLPKISQKMRNFLFPFLLKKNIITFGKEGEIIWKKNTKSSYRSSHFFYRIVELNIFFLFSVLLFFFFKLKTFKWERI